MNRRQWYEEHTLNLGRAVARTGLTPNQLTLLSLIPAVISAYFFSCRRELLGGLFLVITLAFDVLDGSVARAQDRKTDFGFVLDATIDRYCEVVVLFGIACGGFAEGWVVLLCFSGMIMASYVRARIESKGVSAMSVGLMERMQKMTVLLLGVVLYGFFDRSITAALLLIGILSHVTAFQRLLYARRAFP
ncbi:MAG: CDP-alcohol phosphatidyltransferase family protein [Theionarchaea archaeon]|nr:CDP-alcohol phosphatidyltransferase family protein [Theionarchaea archaeon]MBU7001973.1 CDP-alcohol phosphatidyltransferase family protein [Theionarchaea archaeon]MBU7019776.1 CDP-alcohol phosphatidyltransferase family protein [Theionarchaea archaeon]MBU7034604.1 CDP-alcohol phosphatidyltransferase family protein [Theionarchaea archaeon]MBU7041306.1 CDP-alcohol phosphatidyltransferase family protein [Theionarchaea archaeon]